MTDLLNQLAGDAVPGEVVNQFVGWCVWEQARPALTLVLAKVGLDEMVEAINTVDDLRALAYLSHEANAYIKDLRGSTGPLLLSAAEAATFEFSSMTAAAGEEDWDVEGVAFFAARVCGWAGWAAIDFADPAQKAAAEDHARQQQAQVLERLWREHAG
jgi:hypothetical protein